MLIKRRSILQGIAGAACTPLFLRSLSAEAASANDMIVVVVGLSGGNDGLNTVVPLTQYGEYAKLRTLPGGGGSIAYTEASLAPNAFDSSYKTPASASTEYAFAPSMSLMRDLYATGKLAVLTGIGLPSAETAPLSHFNGWSDWSTGQINVDEADLPPGWLGAALAPLPAGALGPTLSAGGNALVITYAGSPGLVIYDPASFNITSPWEAPQFLLGDAYQQMLNLPAANATAGYAQTVTNATVSAANAMQDFANLGKSYPTDLSWLGSQLKTIAQMIEGGSGIRGYVAVTGPFDTHSGQLNTHPQLLGDVSQSLHQFYLYLRKKKLSKNVVIVTISDFGRTPKTNYSLGTDHGAASVAFALGDPVIGGVYGTYPSLKKFDGNGNLAVNVDFRNMLSDVIVAMGGNATSVLGETWPSLGFV
jgi:uncharacterized protein (DUF1501 family)